MQSPPTPKTCCIYIFLWNSRLSFHLCPFFILKDLLELFLANLRPSTTSDVWRGIESQVIFIQEDIGWSASRVTVSSQWAFDALFSRFSLEHICFNFNGKAWLRLVNKFLADSRGMWWPVSTIYINNSPAHLKLYIWTSACHHLNHASNCLHHWFIQRFICQWEVAI